ncbi:MAG: HAD family hydrolase [Deltaproteobacteria bacterium]|nr:HAD family hydrolase [Deltaproteobacteria bacterium]
MRCELSPRASKVRGVLFDFDGTLTRPGAIDFAAIKREIRCPEGTAILEYLDTLPPAERSALLKVLEQREAEAALASVPNEGAEKCLLALKHKGIPFGILTRNSMTSICLALQKFEGIRPEDFTAVITREDSLPKPHPDGVFQAARRMGFTVSALMVVGDFRFDILAGKAAGAFTVLLRNEGPSVMARGDPEPDCTILHLQGVLDILGVTSP